MKNLLLMIVAVTMLFGCSTKTEEVKETKLEKVLQIHKGLSHSVVHQERFQQDVK